MGMARIVAGMAARYVSGAVVDKALGTLLGAPRRLQDGLKTSGLWALLASTVLPLTWMSETR